MAFSSALSNALSGMTAASAAVQVRSANIANATTPGYARRDIALSTGMSGGVRIDSVNRAQDPLLLADRLSADARLARSTANSEAIETMQAAFGEPGDPDGVFAALGAFQSSLDDLANSPDSGTYQRAAVDAADGVARVLNRLGAEVTDMRTEADRDIAATVDDVNTALKALAALNTATPRGGLNGLSGIAEERQSYIDTIAAALEVSVATGREGQVRITTAEGVVLLDETARQLEFLVGGIAAPGTRFENGQLSGLSVDGIELTPGQGRQSIDQGSLAGLFSVRDTVGVSFEERFDALAGELVDRFATSDADSTLLAGQQGLFVGFVGEGAASALTVNASVDPRQGGEIWRMRDGINATSPGPSAGEGITKGLIGALDNARVLSSVTDTASALSFEDALGAFSSVVGAETITARTRLAASAATSQGLRDAELSATGVNTDQELESLLLIEQAYAANARVVQVIDDMMARLMEI